jgi:hypothetical protein
VSMIANPETLTIPAGTRVHICGWPVEVTRDTEVISDRGNIELVRRDLYLRSEEPQAADAVDPHANSTGKLSTRA